jgi:phenylalanyl-tRNA synthetase alpha subunit
MLEEARTTNANLLAEIQEKDQRIAELAIERKTFIELQEKNKELQRSIENLKGELQEAKKIEERQSRQIEKLRTQIQSLRNHNKLVSHFLFFFFLFFRFVSHKLRRPRIENFGK